MLKKLAVFCLLCSCAFGLTVASGCSGGPGEVDVDEAMKNKDKTFGSQNVDPTSDGKDGMRQVD